MNDLLVIFGLAACFKYLGILDNVYLYVGLGFYAFILVLVFVFKQILERARSKGVSPMVNNYNVNVDKDAERAKLEQDLKELHEKKFGKTTP